jgi:protein TonB
MPRIAGAIAAAIALHVAILVLQPGLAPGQRSAAPSSVLAVRLLRAPAVAAEGVAEAAPAPSVVQAREAPAASPPSPPDRKAERQEAAPAQPRSTPGPEPAEPSQRVLADAPDYILGLRLDPGPRPLDEIDPDYPDSVYLRSGTVVLRLLISDTGHVDDVSVVRAEPAGVFEQAAIDAFARARFAPGMAGGVPVKSQIRVEVEFMPINRGGRISGRSY